MATKAKPAATAEEPASVTVDRHISLDMERGSVAVSRNGLTLSVSGKNVQLRKQSPLNLSFDSGEVEYDDGEIQVKAEGDAIKLQLD
ncbi:MAG: hypothetical protein HY912_14695 [Desulfomonile tiedjei]|uniref:Uncharacterized protein n=1 Tax=Desulfomonile tiedjei TaxID=2358 RepID=A0A9D6V693_9BACT|nr:hypothetical protein [Desulfomonile tiedjei]